MIALVGSAVGPACGSNDSAEVLTVTGDDVDEGTLSLPKLTLGRSAGTTECGLDTVFVPVDWSR